MKPFRIKLVEPFLPRFPWILDVGCGLHSPSVTKKYIGECVYHGIEKPGYVGYSTGPNDDRDLAKVDKHILIDLEDRPDLNLLGVSDGKYDCVIASNTLEHFTQDTARFYLRTLPLNLKAGGIFFVEVPSHRVFTSFLPSSYDGIEHRAYFDLSDLVNTVLPTCEILKAGTRRYWRNILRSPVTLPAKLILGMKYPTEYTDLLGLSYYVLAKKRGDE